MPCTHRSQVVVVALALLVSAGCSTPGAPEGTGNGGLASTDSLSVEAPTATDVPVLPEAPLPPGDTDGLAVAYEDELVRTGTVLTRGALIERRVRTLEPGYGYDAPSSDGTDGGSTGSDGTAWPRPTVPRLTVTTQPHLALYLAFIDEDLGDLDRYLDGLVTLTRVFADASFARWSDLESFDVCQVPASDSDASPEPAITLVDITREGHAAWVEAGGDLASLLALADVRGSGVRVQLSEAARAALERGSTT
jgi:hypothetical protein